MKEYYTYILTNKSKTLYTGVTNDIQRRLYEHKHKLHDVFTSKYNIDKLVHLEMFNDINEAIKREKQIKGWVRIKKIELIEKNNPTWRDLTDNS